MELIDIYEPVYETNYLIYIFIALSIVATLLAIYLFLKFRRKEKVDTPEDIYNKALDKILFLKGESGKLEDSVFLKKAKDILINYISYLENNNLEALTSESISERVTNDGYNNLGEIYRENYDSVSYGRAKLTAETKDKFLKETGEYITYLFRREKID